MQEEGGPLGAQTLESYVERVAGFLERGEEVLEVLDGRPSSFLNWALMSWQAMRRTRQVLLTDRNIYVFELEGRERRWLGTPSRMLSEHTLGSVEVRYQYIPPALVVGEDRITPTRSTVARAKPIVREAARRAGANRSRGKSRRFRARRDGAPSDR
jgi:hypothetical protein